MEDYLKAINLAKELYKDNESLRTRNAELEAEVGRLKEALKKISRGNGFGVNKGGTYKQYWEYAREALSQNAGDRYAKMQAVVEAARKYVSECSGCTYPVGLNCNDRCFYSDIEKALADLEGGGGE